MVRLWCLESHPFVQSLSHKGSGRPQSSGTMLQVQLGAAFDRARDEDAREAPASPRAVQKPTGRSPTIFATSDRDGDPLAQGGRAADYVGASVERIRPLRPAEESAGRSGLAVDRGRFQRPGAARRRGVRLAMRSKSASAWSKDASALMATTAIRQSTNRRMVSPHRNAHPPAMTARPAEIHLARCVPQLGVDGGASLTVFELFRRRHPRT